MIVKRLLTALALAAALSCSTTPVETEFEFEPVTPDFSGTVESVREASGRVTIVLVNSTPPPSTDNSRRIVHVGPGTAVAERGRDGIYRPVQPSVIAVGAVLHVKTTGVELRSLPPQYFAVQIVVVTPP